MFVVFLLTVLIAPVSADNAQLELQIYKLKVQQLESEKRAAEQDAQFYRLQAEAERADRAYEEKLRKLNRPRRKNAFEAFADGFNSGRDSAPKKVTVERGYRSAECKKTTRTASNGPVYECD